MHHQGPQPRQASGATKIPNRRRRHRAPFPAPGILDKDLQGLAAQDLGRATARRNEPAMER